MQQNEFLQICHNHHFFDLLHIYTVLFICKITTLSFFCKQLKFLFHLAIDSATIISIAITRLSSDGSRYKNTKIKQLIISSRGRGKLQKYKCIMFHNSMLYNSSKQCQNSKEQQYYITKKKKIFSSRKRLYIPLKCHNKRKCSEFFGFLAFLFFGVF